MKSLIIADIHGNLAALEAVLERERCWDEVLFLGDVCEAGPDVDGVLSLLSTLDGVFIMGNHDLSVLKDDSRVDRKLITDRNLGFLGRFQETCVWHTQGLSLRLVHGRLPSEWGGRLWPDSDAGAFSFLADAYPEPYILSGHSHVQFRRTHNGTHFVNPGSVGAPYLGQPLACYGVLQEGQIEMKATDYDVEKTCRAMEALADRGLKDRQVAESWKTGWRTGTLPELYHIRDYSPLVEQGYR